MKRILFVDDELSALQGIKRMLRSFNREWNIQLAESGPEALELLEKGERFDLVVSDIRMPGMDGIEFLGIVKERYPLTARFALSGQTDSQSLLRISTVTHQFISKPCHPRRLSSLVARTLAIREHLRSEPMRKLLLGIGSLPSLPVLYQKIIEEIQSPEPSVRVVGEIIIQDVAMSAKVLQIVNSAYMGLGHEVSDPIHAASLLGLENLKSIALSIGIFSTAEGKKLPGGFSLDELWQHSLQVAEYAKRIAEGEVEDRRIVDYAFTAGLLHEAGQIVLATHLSKEFGEALALAGETGESLFEAENRLFGATHAQIGAFLLELWGLPDAIVEAIAFHDFPSGRPADNFDGYQIDDEDDAFANADLGAAEKNAFDALTALHVANYFSSGAATLGQNGAKTELDTFFLEGQGYAGRLESWWDLCFQANS